MSKNLDVEQVKKLGTLLPIVGSLKELHMPQKQPEIPKGLRLILMDQPDHTSSTQVATDVTDPDVYLDWFFKTAERNQPHLYLVPNDLIQACT